jgi:cytochrome c553
MKKVLYTLTLYSCLGFSVLSCKKDDGAEINCNTSGLSVTATPGNVSCSSTDGSLTLTGSGGKAPYQYSIDGTSFKADGNFTGLAARDYSVTIKDANGCISTASAKISVAPASISFTNDIQSIITTNCAITGCHIAGGNGNGNFTDFSTIKSKAAQIKTRTGNKSMPIGRSLTDEQIRQIACWVDAGAPSN